DQPGGQIDQRACHDACKRGAASGADSGDRAKRRCAPGGGGAAHAHPIWLWPVEGDRCGRVGYPGRDREIRARAEAPRDRPDVRSAGARTNGDGRTPDRVASVFPAVYRLPMRLKSSIWVAAYLRRCQTEGIFGAGRKRGAEEAGAVFVKVALLDGNAMLYAPAPQTVYDESRPAERLFAPASPQPVPEQSVEERLAKELRFDPDAWIVETEDRAGRHFLDLAKA